MTRAASALAKLRTEERDADLALAVRKHLEEKLPVPRFPPSRGPLKMATRIAAGRNLSGPMLVKVAPVLDDLRPSFGVDG
jgi:hypothetical protein